MKNQWWKETENKRVSFLNEKYRGLILSICSKTYYSYPKTALEIGDIYNEVLFELNKSLFYFNEQIPITAFIVIKTKFYSKNICKKYLSKKYQVLNRFVPLEEKYLKVSDSDKKNIKIDISHLNSDEKKIFNMIYLDNMKKVKIASILKMSRSKLSRTEKIIIKKIKIKNV